MVKPRAGYIPKTITFVNRSKTQVVTNWSDSWYQGEPINKIEVIPSFPVPGGREDLMETARRWAGRSVYDYKTSKHIEQIVTEQTEPNDGTCLIVCGIEYRSEGGRAYKVLDDKGRYFDFREDILLDTLLSEGCEPNGLLGGRYLWARVGSQMKLLREGSSLHKQMILATERGVLKPIKVKDLEPGRVYSAKNGDKQIFLGFVRVQKKKMQVWFELWSFNSNQTPVEEYNEDKKDQSYTRCNIKASRSVIEAHEMISGISPIGDIIKMWRPVYQRMAEAHVENYRMQRGKDGESWKYNTHVHPLADDLNFYKNWALAYEMDGKPPVCKAITENLQCKW